MGRDDADTHRRVGTALARAIGQIGRHNGRVFSFSGDGLMAEFPSAVKALVCALRIQAANTRQQQRQQDRAPIVFRIGLHAGDIVDQDGRAGGDAVNIAARLEQIAEAGTIFLSRDVFEQTARVVHSDYAHIGERHLKNIDRSIGVYRASRLLPRQSSHLVPPLPRADYRPSVAVLPFRALQPNQEDSYFAAGIVDDIIHSLAGLRDLLVIARPSLHGFAQRELDLSRVGRELGVRYVVHGSVRRAGHQLRITAELCDSETGGVLWSERFDGSADELFALQDRIAVRVVGTIAPQVRELQLRLALRKHPNSMTAYDLVLQAMDLFYRLEAGTFAQARKLLLAALDQDSSYAPAWSNLAYWHVTHVGQGWAADERSDTDAAARAAASALEHDPNDAQALAISGHMQSYLFKNYDRATNLLDRALQAGPNCALAWCLSSLTSGFLGDGEAAIHRAEHALRLSPMAPDLYWYQIVLAQAYYIGDRVEDAVSLSRKAFAGNDTHTGLMRTLIASLVAAGDMAEANAVAQRMLRVDPAFRLATFRLRTPLRGRILEDFIDRLGRAGLPD